MNRHIIMCTLLTVLAGTTLLTGSLVLSHAGAAEGDDNAVSSYIQSFGGKKEGFPKADWTRGEFRAMGMAALPENPSMSLAQRKVLRREAAIVIAERNLAKAVYGVHITSETTVKNLVLEDDTIKAKVEAFLKGHRVVSERDPGDGTYEVVVALNIYGDEGLSTVVNLEEQAKEDAPKEVATLDELPKPEKVTGDYTGLLIDCRDFKVQPAMATYILDERKEALYIRQEVTWQVCNEKGIVEYYKSEDEAKKVGRVGNKPLVVKATDMVGKGGFLTSPVVVQADAARILAEDQRNPFLNKLAVGYIVK